MIAAAAGLFMLAAAVALGADPARLTLAIGALCLLSHATATRRRVDVAVEDLAEVEASVIDLRARVSAGEQCVARGMRDMRRQVSVICDQLAD